MLACWSTCKVEELRASFRCLAPDLRGHGDSAAAWGDEVQAPLTFVDDVLAVADLLVGKERRVAASPFPNNYSSSNAPNNYSSSNAPFSRHHPPSLLLLLLLLLMLVTPRGNSYAPPRRMASFPPYKQQTESSIAHASICVASLFVDSSAGSACLGTPWAAP